MKKHYLKKCLILVMSLAMVIAMVPQFGALAFAEEAVDGGYPEAEAVALEPGGGPVQLAGTLTSPSKSDYYKFTVPEGKSICLDLSSTGQGVNEVELTPLGYGTGGSPNTGTGVQIVRERDGYTFDATSLRTYFMDFGTSRKICLNAATYYVQVMAQENIATRGTDKNGNVIYYNAAAGNDTAYLSYNYTVTLNATELEDVAAGKQNGDRFRDAVDVELNESYHGVQALSCLSPLGSADPGNTYEEYRLVLDRTAKIRFALSEYNDNVGYTEITIFKEGGTPYYGSKLLSNLDRYMAPNADLECVLSKGTYFISLKLFHGEYVEQDTDFGTPYVLTVEEKENDAPELTGLDPSMNDITLHWNAVEDAVSYRVYRRFVTEDNYYDDEPYRLVAENVNDTSYADASGEMGQVYGYTVSAVFADGTESAYDNTGLTGARGFRDVRSGQYYYNAVLWAVKNGITTGTSKTAFSPDDSCTRAQMVTFLWRTAGQPEPSSQENPFEDVQESAYYYKAVLWAVENKITNGMSDTTFEPEGTVTRGQTATFLFRYKDDAVVPSIANPFNDVNEKAYYYEPVLWAYHAGVTKGVSEDSFAPGNDCTRGQIVTFLWRSEGEPEV